MKKTRRLTRLALTLFAPLALALSIPGALFADNNAYSFQGTTPSNCKILQYRGEKPATGKIEGTTITIDAGLNTGFGVPITGKTLYSVSAFTLGRSNCVDDLYFDVDATEAFDYVLGSDAGK